MEFDAINKEKKAESVSYQVHFRAALSAYFIISRVSRISLLSLLLPPAGRLGGAEAAPPSHFPNLLHFDKVPLTSHLL